MDLTLPSNWSLEFQESITFGEIPMTLPSFFTSTIVAVNVVTSAQKGTWFNGGYVNQVISTGLIDDSYSWKTYSQRLLLGNSILTFASGYDGYALQFSFPYYFPDAELSVWQYKET